MNMALRGTETSAQSALTVFAFFHLNLAFSSIEEERRDEVIARCYWPLLKLAERVGPLGLEVNGHTLEEIAARDPAWIAAAKAAIARGDIELIGSGYSQMIGPLVPAKVTRENLRLGLETYDRLLGTRPRLALVNEQAYAGGLVRLYAEAGFDALIMDFDNPAAHHPEWPAETAWLPHHAFGPDGSRIALIWSNTMAFQQLQRLAHGDTTLDHYRDFVRGRRGTSPRTLCLYASDAEIFDFRPGRFKTEERLSDNSEWDRITAAIAAVREDGARLVAPSAILKLLDQPGAGRDLVLESAACPVPVKKQRKYNLARWAVTGKDNLAINAACERIYRGMQARGTPDWKELCYLWASDFRTHLTAKRWDAYRTRLAAADARWSAPPAAPALLHGPATDNRYIHIRTPALSAQLDRRRGLAISRLHFHGQALPTIGGLPHGFFDDIALAADWYTGDCVFEAPGEHKITDLEWAQTQISEMPDGAVTVEGRVATPNGAITKILHFHHGKPRVDFDITFDWPHWDKGVLRLGHFTLLPDAFDLSRLMLATTNGGERETFALAGQTVDHGAAVSFLVSSSFGLGMTEGWAEIGDGATTIRIDVDRTVSPLLGMLSHRPARRADGRASVFCQLQVSARELDDTAKPSSYQDGPRRFRFSVRAV